MGSLCTLRNKLTGKIVLLFANVERAVFVLGDGWCFRQYPDGRPDFSGYSVEYSSACYDQLDKPEFFYFYTVLSDQGFNASGVLVSS
ncbi:hypothetical protein SAMN04488122_1378 [Chitinophaga arvensicola]|uniref:Uncharacterized protein n=1 Tax=Chitinophaga arvensicola TaxID=29529 RepID=A0A1I0QCH6_9BACT|nr:hypothetical protein SAMN04488122_1378 [Chitinophaga arvensicola]